MVDDPYKVLGISRDADKDEIKRAYRKKAKEYHPDLHPNDPKAAEKMNEINEAYDMLNNPEKYQKQQQTRNGYGNPYGQSYGGSYGQYGGGSYGQRSSGQYQNGGYQNGGYQNGGYQNGSYRNGGYQNGQYQNGQGGYQYDPFGFGDMFGFGARTQAPPKPSVEPGDDADIRQAVDFINAGRYDYANNTLNQMVSARRNARWNYLSALANQGLGNSIQAVEKMKKAVQMEPSNQVYQSALRWMQQSGTAYNENGQEYQRAAAGMDRLCLSFCAMQFFCMFCRC